MEEKKERTWTWLMPSGKTCKVVTNPESGTVKVYDQNGKLVRKEEKLSEEAVSIIEKDFLEITTAKVKEKEKGTETEMGNGTKNELLETEMYIR